MTTVKEIYSYIKEFAPEELAEGWDNVGILLGNEDAKVSGILFALDVDMEVIDKAVDVGANLIITHHPVIFSPLKNVNCKNPTSKVIYYAAGKNINVISAHTNLDAADEGVSWLLAQMIGLENISTADSCTSMRVGELPTAMTISEFVDTAKARINVDKADITRNQPDKVKKVAVISGSGGSFIEEAKELDCDVLFTGEMKHSDAVYANIINQCIVACGHHETEVIILDSIKKYLQTKLYGVKLRMDAYDKAPTIRV